MICCHRGGDFLGRGFGLAINPLFPRKSRHFQDEPAHNHLRIILGLAQDRIQNYTIWRVDYSCCLPK